jgi:hypothetical protein
MMNDNTKRLVRWTDRMMEKTGYCGAALCEVLAYFCDESEESPSDYALRVAFEWEKNPELVTDIIKESGGWCLTCNQLRCPKRIWQED